MHRIRAQIKLSREEARALFGALQHNQQIQELLYLPYYCKEHFSREELRAMDNRVWFCRLKEFD